MYSAVYIEVPNRMRFLLLALCLLTQLGSNLTQGRDESVQDSNSISSHPRTKREGLSSLLGRMFTPQRRQSFGVSSPEPGQISFSLPILKTLGLPQPLAPLFTRMLHRRIDDVRHLIRKAEPVVLESATKWKHTVDTHIAPRVKAGLEVVGQHAIAGVTAGVDTLAEVVLGEEKKHETYYKVGETVAAFKTIAKSVIGPDITADDAYKTNFDQEQIQYTQSGHEHYDDSYYFLDHIDPRREESYDYPDYQRVYEPENVEEALYVIGTNILGQNVTDRIYPVAKQVVEGFNQVGDGLSTITDAILPSTSVEFDSSGVRVKTVPNPSQPEPIPATASRGERNSDQSASGSSLISTSERNAELDSAPKCTTPQRSPGKCMDIQNCPLLLADLDKLRKSICFKSLFVPGVCCPDTGVQLELLDDGLNVVNEVQEVNEGGPFLNSSRPSIPASSPTHIGSNKPPTLSDIFAPPPPPPPSSSRPTSPVDASGSLTSNKIIGTDLECGVTKIPQARIVGGNATFEGEFPWMVAIYLHGKNRREFWCGGALITPNHVISAAHCTRDAKKRPFRASQFSVRVGEWDLKDNDNYSEEFRVIDFTAHPNFRPNGFYNDIAIFTLDQPVNFSPHIQAICLPNGRNLERDYVNTLPIALGWGTTHYGGEEVSKLRGVPLPVWTNKDCDRAYFQPITEVFLCAGYADGGRDACQGDSGGPLMLYDEDSQSWMLIGVVSFGNRCAEPGYPGVYTRITHFMPFIKSVIL